MTEPIAFFRGEHAFLSNFYPTIVEHDGLRFLNAEAAYQAAKLADVAARSPFRTYSPGEAKRQGRRVSLRAGWDAMKLGVMSDVLASKFVPSDIAYRLVSTGDAELIEGNTWGDRYWGVCDGQGANHLGRLLMELRTKLATA